MFHARVFSATCFHEPNLSRKSILESHLQLFGASHNVVTVGNPDNPKARSLIDSIQQKLSYKSGSHDEFVHVLVFNLLLSRASTLPDSRNILQRDLSKSANRLVAHAGAEIKWARPRPLRLAEISLAMKHKYAMSLFLAQGVAEYCIILEDDAVVQEGTENILHSLIKHLDGYSSNAYYKYIDLGSGCNMNLSHINEAPSLQMGYTNLYSPLYPSSRTTCAYLVNRKMAQYFLKLYGYLYTAPIDLELTFALNTLSQSISIRKHLQCLWAEPEIFVHGSENDKLFESSMGH